MYADFERFSKVDILAKTINSLNSQYSFFNEQNFKNIRRDFNLWLQISFCTGHAKSRLNCGWTNGHCLVTIQE